MMYMTQWCIYHMLNLEINIVLKSLDPQEELGGGRS